MNDLFALKIAQLRERALQCKAMARRAGNEAVATAAENMARDYEDEAARLEGTAPKKRHTEVATSVCPDGRAANNVVWERIEKTIAALRQVEPRPGERVN